MDWKKVLVCAVVAVLCSAPSWAGSFGAYGSYWDSDEADKSLGAGARIGFNFVKFLELEFHGTHYPDFKTSLLLTDVDIKATPVDGGLRVNLLPSAPVNPYVGAGVSYYFLDTDKGNIDNKTGWYGEAGLDLGAKNTRFFAEALWRKLDTSIGLGVFNADTKFDGVAVNSGVVWRWGN